MIDHHKSPIATLSKNAIETGQLTRELKALERKMKSLKTVDRALLARKIGTVRARLKEFGVGDV